MHALDAYIINMANINIVTIIHLILQCVQMQLVEVLPFTLSQLFSLLWDSRELQCCYSEMDVTHLPAILYI